MIGGDYRQTVDPGILAYCLVNYVNQPPTFYTHEFKLLADNLSRLDMHQNEVTKRNEEQLMFGRAVDAHRQYPCKRPSMKVHSSFFRQ